MHLVTTGRATTRVRPLCSGEKLAVWRPTRARQDPISFRRTPSQQASQRRTNAAKTRTSWLETIPRPTGHIGSAGDGGYELATRLREQTTGKPMRLLALT